MSCFDKPKRKFAPQPEIPERLKRLNRELAVERTKDHDYLFAVRDGHRIKVCIFRMGAAPSYSASAKIGGRVWRYNDVTPAMAFNKLTNALKHVVSQLDYEREMSNNMATA